MKKLLTSLSLLSAALFFGQVQPTEKPEKKEESKPWYYVSYAQEGIYGVGSTEANEIAKKSGIKPSPIVVAVVDSGVDVEHEDLQQNVWVNTNEIPENGIDDDQNGYIDDVHGWNFIGGKEGNVAEDNLEITRMVRDYQTKFASKDSFTNARNKEKFPAEFESYKKLKNQFEERLAQAKLGLNFITKQKEQLTLPFQLFGESYGMDKKIQLDSLRAFSPSDEKLIQIKDKLISTANSPQATFFFGRSINDVLAEISKEFKDQEHYYGSQVNYQYNLDFDPRKLVGDDYSNKQEKHYGNNDVEGAGGDATHGTHVGGIIAADRTNTIGMDGISEFAKIMSVRTVPDGDERDKDVANALRYAVDNGAKIINMSFGKSLSPEKEEVWEAMKYATEHDVLLVHAAGNENKDIDTQPNYPTNYKDDKKEISSTWITVGASTAFNENLKASFSNYGKEQVDVFAPGLDIYSTIPDNKYKSLDGTSMAAPVVSGVAAFVWSYFPEFTAQEIKQILIESGNPAAQLEGISKHAVVVDAVKAFELALKKQEEKK